MLEAADATRCDHRDRHGVGDRARQAEVETVAGTVAIHGGEQDFAGAEAGNLDGVFDGVDAGRLPPAVGEDFPRSAALASGIAPLARVDGDDDRLGAELLRCGGDDAAVVHRRGVDRNLVGPGKHQRAHVLDAAHAAADGDRHEADLRRARDDVEDRAAVFVAGRDVEEAKLVGSGGVIGARRLDRVAGIGEVEEADPLHHAAVLDVEAGDDADLEGHAASRVARTSFSAAAASSRPS